MNGRGYIINYYWFVSLRLSLGSFHIKSTYQINKWTRGMIGNCLKKRVNLDAGRFRFGSRVCDEWNKKGNLDHYLRDNRGFKEVMLTLSSLESFAWTATRIVCMVSSLHGLATVLGKLSHPTLIDLHFFQIWQSCSISWKTKKNLVEVTHQVLHSLSEVSHPVLHSLSELTHQVLHSLSEVTPTRCYTHWVTSPTRCCNHWVKSPTRC